MVRKSRQITLVLASTLLATSCRGDTVLGFAIGDISGLWIAESVVYTANNTSGVSVDVVQRDGASMTLAVDSGVAPPIVSMSYDDGSGTETVGGGTVDVQLGTLRIESDVYVVTQDGNRMTLTNADANFDFGSGAQSATLTIVLNRL